MKIIISGTVDIDPEQMEAAMTAAKPLIEGALTQEGIMDYDWCPDPLTPGRIRVFERWESQQALENHLITIGIRTCGWRWPSLVFAGQTS